MNRYRELVSKKAYYEVLCEEQKETIKKLEDKYLVEKYKVRNVFIANPLLDNEIRKQGIFIR